MNVRQAWITLNRDCNLRCNWCYARGTGFDISDRMQEGTVKKLISFLTEIRVQNLYFIGGEPTCDERLEHFIFLAYERGLLPELITNGVALQNEQYLFNLKRAGLKGINLSMKGWSKESYVYNTGKNVYSQVLQGIGNVSKLGISFVVSFVLSSINVDSYLDVVLKAVECGAKQIYLSFEQDFSALDGNLNRKKVEDSISLIRKFEKSYEELCRITGGNFVLHQSLPFCIWNPSVLEELKNRQQLSSNCQLRERSGLVFDTDASLIMCNSLYHIPIGKFDEDFSDRASFVSFWNSKKIREIYSSLSKLPAKECDSCKDKTLCGGGCIANWLHYDLNQLKLGIKNNA